MTMTATLTTDEGRRTTLEHVMLSSNPQHGSRWADRTGYPPADIATVGAARDGNWSVSCNLDKIGPGSMAWIARYQGVGKPVLAGFLVPDDYPYEDPTDPGEWYVTGILCGWSPQLWVPGATIVAAGWATNQAPFGDRPQFANGRRVMSGDLKALLSTIDPSILDYIGDQFERVNGYRPTWA